MLEAFKTAKLLKELTERVETVERQLQGLKIEWADVLDRMVTMNKRIVRAQRLAEARGDTADTGLTHLSDEDVASGGTSLNERQRAANAAILARRNRSQ